MECSYFFFFKLSMLYTKKNSDPVYEKQNQNKITTTHSCLSFSGKGDPLYPEKCALTFFFFFFFFNQWTVCALCCVSISRLWRRIITTFIPLCRQCSSWGQILLLSLPQTLHLCHTWGFQKQLVHYYFHVQSIQCTVF